MHRGCPLGAPPPCHSLARSLLTAIAVPILPHYDVCAFFEVPNKFVPFAEVALEDSMPLFKKSSFLLMDPPKDLDPKEKVFQVRFTKEIFRDYQEYMDRLNLYRKRVWACKVSGKSNLTYEEALVSEQRAAEKAQQLPRELMTPVLQMVQYSTLSLTDLVNKIYGSLQEDLSEGSELHAKKDGSEAACKILKVIRSDNPTMYEIGWIGQDKSVLNTSVVGADDLCRKKAPASRHMLKIFIRESTSQNSPWIVHASVANKYGIPTEPPKDMINGEGLPKARKRLENGIVEDARKRLKQDEEQLEQPVKYPIDDLLVKPAADDLVLSKKFQTSRDFKVPANSVGDLLMIWDFCMSFGWLLCLSPFSLSDLENAVCHKETNPLLLVEIHAALLHLLIKDEGEYFAFIQNKKRKLKISLVTWAEYLCDFMEMKSTEEISSHISTVRRGHYGLVHTGLKLQILQELVDEAIATAAVKENLDERIGQQTALAAAKREVVRKIKEEQKLSVEGAAKNKVNQTDAAQNGSENVNDHLVGKKAKEMKNAYASKMGDQKKCLMRHIETEMVDQSIRTSPLGKDRFHNRYWFFRREGRLFVENVDPTEWGYCSTKEELDALIGSLNIKGVRERALKQQFDRFYDKISNALEKRTKEASQKVLLEESILRRSSRMLARPKDNDPSMSFLEYVNKRKPLSRRSRSKED